MKSLYALLADITLITHTCFVLFVIVGQILVIIGWARRWKWPCSPLFRYIHLGAIALVVLQSWFGVFCPLTHLENFFRVRSGTLTYEKMSFIGYWLNRFLYYQAPPWVFATCYALFGLLVLTFFYVYPPHRKKINKRSCHEP